MTKKAGEESWERDEVGKEGEEGVIEEEALEEAA